MNPLMKFRNEEYKVPSSFSHKVIRENVTLNKNDGISEESFNEFCSQLVKWNIETLTNYGTLKFIPTLCHISFPHLRYLFLGNEIESIEQFHRMGAPSLEQVFINYNKINSMKDFRKMHWPSFFYLSMQGNSIQDGQEMTRMSMKKEVNELNIEYWDDDVEQCSDMSWVLKMQIPELKGLSSLMVTKKQKAEKGQGKIVYQMQQREDGVMCRLNLLVFDNERECFLEGVLQRKCLEMDQFYYFCLQLNICDYFFTYFLYNLLYFYLLIIINMQPQFIENGGDSFNLQTILQWSKPQKCSCCEGQKQYCWGFLKKQINADVCLRLTEAGWVHSGIYFYKINMMKSCCKRWTHRQDVTKFRIKKDQRKTVRRMLKFVYGLGDVQEEKKEKQKKQEKMKDLVEINEEHLKIMNNFVLLIEKFIKVNFETFVSLLGSENIISENFQNQFIIQKVYERNKVFISKPEEKFDYYCSYFMLLFGLNKKLFAKGFTAQHFISVIREWIESNVKDENIFNFQLERSGYLLMKVNSGNSLLKKEKKEKECLLKKSMISEHELGLEQVIEDDYFRISSDLIQFGKLKIEIVEAEKSEESWELYKKSQFQIHGRVQNQRKSYNGFLCEKVIIPKDQVTEAENQKKYLPFWDTQQKYSNPQKIQGKRTKKIGSHHMKYYFQEKLIAVGVVDILQQGMISQYFFYDPSFKKRRLGVFSSLIEIEYVHWLNKSFPQFKYYYLGCYIQNNRKLNYKVNYQPCQILCPATLKFVDFNEEVKEKIGKFQNKEINDYRLAGSHERLAEDFRFPGDLQTFIENNINLLYQGKNTKFSELPRKWNDFFLEYFLEYIKLWGKTVFRKFIFSFNE